MHSVTFTRRRPGALAPAAVLLLALCLLAVGVQALTDSPALVINEPGRYTLDHDLSSDSSIGVLINSSDVVLDGMGHRIEGTDATGSSGVVVGGISAEPRVVNVTVRNLTVRHWDSGIVVVRASGSVVEHVISEQNGIGLRHGGLESMPSENGIVRDSIFRNNTWIGISLGYPFGGITIERCQVTGNGRGMEFVWGLGTYDSYRGSPSLVADCDISGNQGYGLEIREDGLSARQGVVSAVRNCTIRGNGGDGVVVGRSTTTIIGNRVVENGGYGVNAGDSGGSNITSNWIAGNRYGVSAGGDWPSRVQNNVLNNTDNGNFGVPLDNGYLNYTKAAGPNIIGGPYLGGNVWAFPNGTGFSQTHPDTNGDGFCDEPYPVTEDAVDYLPLAIPGGNVMPTPTSTPTPTPTPIPNVPPTPYKPLSVPGRIQAEDYNLGGEGVAYHDTTPGNEGGAYRHDDVDIETAGGITNVGWIRDGERLTYTANVSRDGIYLLSLRVASPNSGRSVDVAVNGGQSIMYRLPNTGSFETYATATLGSTFAMPGVTATQTPMPTATGIENQRIRIRLSAGTAVIVLTFHGDGQNLDWFEIVPDDGTAPPPDGPDGQPYPASHLVPGRVESEDYDVGGFSDTTPANEGGAYRQDAVDIERGGSGYNVGWIRPGEYLEYSVDTTGPLAYQIYFRVANPGPAKTVTVRVNGEAKTLTIPATGGFQNWQKVMIFAGWLNDGRNLVRIETGTAGSFNLDYMEFDLGDTPPPTTVITTPPTTPPAGGGATFVAAPATAPKGSAVKFTVTPASGKSIRSAWWSFDAAAHLNTWNSRNVNPTFFYPAKGTFSPLVKLTYTDGSTETVERTNYVRAT